MKFFSYVSTRACYDPAKTIILFAPQKSAGSADAAEAFARSSGWINMAEANEAVLLVPVAEHGWEQEPLQLPCDLYNQMRNEFRSLNGRSISGRGGKLWLWETLIYWVGYREGAEFAHRCAVRYPNHFAAAAFIDGVSEDFTDGALPSDHWMVRNVSEDYQVKNCDIPSSVWMIGSAAEKTDKAVKYYAVTNGYDVTKGIQTELCGIQTECFCPEKNPGYAVYRSAASYPYDECLAAALMNGYFSHYVRWKESPDGCLKRIKDRTEFYTDGTYTHLSVECGQIEYPVAVHLPSGMEAADAAGLPLLISVHGRGESAHLFAQKNGFEELADHTREFVLALPDSPGNIWFFDRDRHVFEKVIEKMKELYAIDTERIYLAGFSNGGQITREIGTADAHLYAAVAPFNGPAHIAGFTRESAISPELKEGGYELPYWVTVGDNDPVTGTVIDDQIEEMLGINGCDIRKAGNGICAFEPDEVRNGENWYTAENGWHNGERFTTAVFKDGEGREMVGFTIMKNMPHGQIPEQGRACWDFMKQYRRPQGSRKVTINGKGE